MAILIRAAEPSDGGAIRRIHHALKRPKRPLRTSEYLVAADANGVIGCAAVRMFRGGGYLYGLAVRRQSQHVGVGSALTCARIEWIRQRHQPFAVVLAMFWNVGFFRKLGFVSIRRDRLPSCVRRLADFRNPRYKHSAVLWRAIEI